MRGQTVAADDVRWPNWTRPELALSAQQARDALRIQELTMAQRVNSEPSPAQLAPRKADAQAAEANVQVPRPTSAQASLQQAQAQRTQLTGRRRANWPGRGPGLAAAAAKQAQEPTTGNPDHHLHRAGHESGREVRPGLARRGEQARGASGRRTRKRAEAQAADLNNDRAPALADIQAVDATIAGPPPACAAEGKRGRGRGPAGLRARAAADLLLGKPSADETAILEAQVTAPAPA